MCEICAIFTIGEHWTDKAHSMNATYPAGDIQRYRQERKFQVALVNRLLATFGAACEDWDGDSFAVVDRHGRQKIVPTLSAVWPQAEALSGSRLDPLSFEWLATLATVSTAG